MPGGKAQPVAERTTLMFGEREVVPIFLRLARRRDDESSEPSLLEMAQDGVMQIVEAMSKNKVPVLQTSGSGGNQVRAFKAVAATLELKRVSYASVVTPKEQVVKVPNEAQLKDGKLIVKDSDVDWVDKTNRAGVQVKSTTYYHGMMVVPIEDVADALVVLTETANAWVPSEYKQWPRKERRDSKPKETEQPPKSKVAVKSVATQLAAAVPSEGAEEL